MESDNRTVTPIYIFFEVLLIFYALITTAAIVLFEYNIITISKGEVIFTFSMCWQVLLFLMELVTILIQLIMMFKCLKQADMNKYTILRNAGYTGVLFALTAAIGVIVTDGFVVFPTVTFVVYFILIVIVRGLLVPKTVKKLINPVKHF